MTHYVVIDLEMCKVPHCNKKLSALRQEIIEIGAVLLDESLRIVDEFKTFVAPEYGKLDSYIENLTHIRNADLVGAPRLRDALKVLFAWLPDNVTMVAWSENDKGQLLSEVQSKRIRIARLDALLETAIDSQAMFAQKIGSKKSYKLTHALCMANIVYEEGIHDALVDARNTALLFAKIMREETMSMNPYYVNDDTVSSGYCPFADLLSALHVAV